MEPLLAEPAPLEPVELWGDGVMIPAPVAAAGAAPAAAHVPATAGASDLGYAQPWVDAPPPAPEGLAARAALEGRFIVEEQVEGQSYAPNSVTPETYQELLAVYADLAAGRGDLQIGGSEGDPAAFRAAALEDIARILQSPHGRDLIRELHRNVVEDEDGGERHMTTTIEGVLNRAHIATVGPGPGWEADAEAAVPMDATSSYRGTDEHTHHGVVRSDVLLFHELRHALDMTGGSLDMDDHGGVAGYELQAVGLGGHAQDGMTENAYRADRARIGDAGVGEVAGDADMVRRESYDHFRL